MHYVIGDVHGCYDELMALIDQIETIDSEAQFILVGDLIDRGPKVWEVLQWALKNITPDGRYQCVRGNHEQLALEWWEDYKRWYDTGRVWPEAPYSEYDIAGVLYNHIAPTGESGMHSPEDFQVLVDFWNSLPYSKKIVVETTAGTEAVYRIVHAWYDYRLEENTHRQHYKNLYQRKYGGNYRNPEEIIVYGHTPTVSERFMETGRGIDSPGMICFREQAVNVDCGCVFSRIRPQYPCMLGAFCLETLEEIYPCTWEERIRQQYLAKYDVLLRQEALAGAEEAIASYRKAYLHEKNWINPFKRKLLRKLRI